MYQEQVLANNMNKRKNGTISFTMKKMLIRLKIKHIRNKLFNSILT